MFRWVCALVVSAVLTGFALLLVTGQYENEGSVVASVTPNHGLHQGDVFIVLGWAVAMSAVLALTISANRGQRSPRS